MLIYCNNISCSYKYRPPLQRGGQRDPHVLHRQPPSSAARRGHGVLWGPAVPLPVGDGRRRHRGGQRVNLHSQRDRPFKYTVLCHQLPSDATRPLDQEDFSPQVRDVSHVTSACHRIRGRRELLLDRLLHVLKLHSLSWGRLLWLYRSLCCMC